LNKLKFARLVAGMSTDHAKDQKLLFRLFEAWKLSCKREMRGKEALLSASLTEIIPLLWKETQRNIEDIGGMAAWEALSAGEWEVWEVAAYH
jgi:putative hemolysin